MQSFKVSNEQKNRAYYRIYSKYIDMMERDRLLSLSCNIPEGRNEKCRNSK